MANDLNMDGARIVNEHHKDVVFREEEERKDKFLEGKCKASLRLRKDEVHRKIVKTTLIALATITIVGFGFTAKTYSEHKTHVIDRVVDSGLFQALPGKYVNENSQRAFIFYDENHQEVDYDLQIKMFFEMGNEMGFTNGDLALAAKRIWGINVENVSTIEKIGAVIEEWGSRMQDVSNEDVMGGRSK